jgi:hypothetical protein
MGGITPSSFLAFIPSPIRYGLTHGACKAGDTASDNC